MEDKGILEDTIQKGGPEDKKAGNRNKRYAGGHHQGGARVGLLGGRHGRARRAHYVITTIMYIIVIVVSSSIIMLYIYIYIHIYIYSSCISLIVIIVIINGGSSSSSGGSSSSSRLIGANGCGKSTLLMMIQVLCNAML